VAMGQILRFTGRILVSAKMVHGLLATPPWLLLALSGLTVHPSITSVPT